MFKNKRLQTVLIGTLLIGGAGITPSIPYEVPPHSIVSYETVRFDTSDGDIDLNEYALNPSGGFYIRRVPKDEGNFSIVPDSATSSPTVGKQLVSVLCERCAYYQEFQGFDGTKKRIQYTQKAYKDLGKKDAKPATVTELITPIAALAKVANAAIATDSTGTAVSGLNSVTSLTYALNNTAGNILFTCITTGGTISDVTYNSVSSTHINTSGGGQPARLYYQVSPSTGSNNVVVTTTGTTYIYSASSAYTGAKLTGQPDASNTNSASRGAGVALTTSVTTVADNSWGIICARNDTTGNETASTGSTLRVGGGSGFVQIFDSNSPKTPAGSLSMSTTDATSAREINHAMASFAPSVGASFIPWQMFPF